MSESERLVGDEEAAVTTAAEQAPAALPPMAEEPPEPDESRLVVVALLERIEEGQRLLARQTEIATALHDENQRLRAGELRRAQLPLVRDLIRVQDVIGRMLDAAAGSAAAGDLRIVRDAILDALARNGIEPTRHAPGDPLDPRLHKVAGVRDVDDPAADRTIDEIVRTGFTWEDGTAIRAADVRVRKHVARPPAPDPVSDNRQLP